MGNIGRTALGTKRGWVKLIDLAKAIDPDYELIEGHVYLLQAENSVFLCVKIDPKEPADVEGVLLSPSRFGYYTHLPNKNTVCKSRYRYKDKYFRQYILLMKGR